MVEGHVASLLCEETVQDCTQTVNAGMHGTCIFLQAHTQALVEGAYGMKVLMVAAAVAALATPALAQGSHYTRGYVRSDGTYVQPHRSTNPDSSTYNNWSSKPNVNPYTGQQGTRNPTPTYGSSPRTIYGGSSSYGAPRRNCGLYGC